MTTSRRIAGMLALLALPLALPACGNDGGTGLDDSADGTYTLEEANGESLPTIVYSEQTDQGKVDFRMVSGTLTLDGGHYAAEFTADMLIDDQLALEGMPIEDSGTYTVSGSLVTLTSSSADAEGSLTGTLSGNTLTVSGQDPNLGVAIELVFQR